jgi:predicted branched-subunit amino acid permease
MNKKEFIQGFKDGIPIGLGYFAVSFALGIAMKNAGMSWIDGFFMSLFNLASAGEYAGTQVILASGTYLEMIIMTAVANARYMLMSCSLSQKLAPETKTKHRMLIGYAITDELFGIAYSREGYLNPYYFYGGMSASILPWAIGTSCGIVMGNILPSSIVSALSVALYGMFLAIIIPPSRKNKTVLVLVMISFLSSYLCTILPVISSISSGTRILILTVVISLIAAIIKPIKEDTHES